MSLRGNGTSRVLVFVLLFVLIGLNAPGLLSQSQIESPEAPRVTYVLLPKSRCVVAPPSLPADKCPASTLPPPDFITAINWIAADGSDFEGAIGYEDITKDIVRVSFRVVAATEVKDAPPGTFKAGQIFSFEPPAQTSDKGAFDFRIFTTVPQDITLEVTLEDAKRNVSQPKIFSFKAVGPEPIISGIEFQEQIPLGAQQQVVVGFVDREGQLSRVFFQLINFDPKRVGDCTLPTDPNGIDVSEQLGKKEGQLSFPISCNSAQRITMKVVLVDRQGNRSEQSALRQRDRFEFIAGRKVADGLFFLDQFGQDGGAPGEFRRPQGIAVDSQGRIYVADTENHRIQVFDPSTFKLTEKRPSFVWGSRCLLRTGEGCRDPDGGGPLVPGDGQFDGPTDIVVDAAGNIYVVDSGNHRIQRFDSAGRFSGKWGTRGSGDGQFETPIGIALDSSGKIAYVTDKSNHRIQKFDISDIRAVRFLAKWGSECNLTVTPPTGRCVDPDGSGPLQTGDGQFFEPQAIAIDSAGNVYVADTGNHRIQKFDANGKFLVKWGRNGFAQGQFDVPRGMAFTRQGVLLVVDQNNHRVQEFDGEGKFLRQWGVQGGGEGEFNAPQDIAVDSVGNLYIVELLNNRVQKLGDLK